MKVSDSPTLIDNLCSATMKLVRQVSGRLQRVRAESRQRGRQIIKLARAGFGLFVPVGMEEITVQQAKTLRLTAYALSICGTNALVLIMADFGKQVGFYGYLVATCIAFTYLIWVVLVYLSWHHNWFMRVSTSLLVLQGVLWGSMVCKLASVAEGSQPTFVVTIALGLVSTPLLSAPFSIAMAFWLPVAISCS